MKKLFVLFALLLCSGCFNSRTPENKLRNLSATEKTADHYQTPEENEERRKHDSN